MVKRIQLILDDKDFERLKKIKGNKTWEELLVKPILDVVDTGECIEVSRYDKQTLRLCLSENNEH